MRGIAVAAQRIRLPTVSDYPPLYVKAGKAMLGFLFEVAEKRATERGDKITNDEWLRLARARSLEVDDIIDTSRESLRRSLDSSVSVDVDNLTNSERLQLALAMSIMDENDNDDSVSFHATSIEPDEGGETCEGRPQCALAISRLDEDDFGELVA